MMSASRMRAATECALAVLALTAAPARAQLTVYDPANYAQNVMTAARELQQVTNSLQSLQNQATSLLNQARNLTSLPYSALGTLQQSISRTEQLITSAQRITYNVGAINQAFTQTYPQAYGVGTPSNQLLGDALTRWQNARVGYQDAMTVQAGVVQNLDTTRTQIAALIGASQGATGALQAAQSGNQLIALQTKQLADLTAIMASIARAQSLASANALESQAQGQAQMQNFLNYGPGYQAGAAAMFH